MSLTLATLARRSMPPDARDSGHARPGGRRPKSGTRALGRNVVAIRLVVAVAVLTGWTADLRVLAFGWIVNAG